MADSYQWNGKDYPKVKARLLWSLTHYDGPMSGIALYLGKIYFARCHQSVDSRSTRYYWLYPLTDEEVTKETKYQDYFRKYYGYYCDYDENGHRMLNFKPTEPKLSISQRFFNFIFGLKHPFATIFQPSYDEMQRWAGLTWRREEEYTKREAIGYFARWE